MNNILIGVIVVIAIAVLVMAISASGSKNTSSVLFSISDTPAILSSVSSVYVTVQEVSMHSATTGQWYNFSAAGKGAYNLVALKNISAFVANAQVSAGNYDEIVLVISSSNATVNGTVKNVTLPSGKLKIFGNFNISNKTTNWINMDFNVNQSLHTTGNGEIILLPVIQTRFMQGSDVTVEANDTINVSSRGNTSLEVNDGMDANGTMRSNFVVPANANIIINTHIG
ncbi:MAG: DUF4382 domain-containing protein [Candidatus Micrarchaeaceae archaeon]